MKLIVGQEYNVSRGSSSRAETLVYQGVEILEGVVHLCFSSTSSYDKPVSVPASKVSPVVTLKIED